MYAVLEEDSVSIDNAPKAPSREIVALEPNLTNFCTAASSNTSNIPFNATGDIEHN